MALASYAYGTVADVAAYVQHAANSDGTFDGTTTPTISQVETWINRRSALLNACLADVGYAVPVSAATAPQAYAILAHYAANGAAADVELSLRHSGAEGDTENQRAQQFLKVFNAACAFLSGDAFAALLVPSGGAPTRVTAGLYVGGKTRTGQRLRPVFTRTTAGNDPTTESGSPEPAWDDDGGWRT